MCASCLKYIYFADWNFAFGLGYFLNLFLYSTELVKTKWNERKSLAFCRRLNTVIELAGEVSVCFLFNVVFLNVSETQENEPQSFNDSGLPEVSPFLASEIPLPTSGQKGNCFAFCGFTIISGFYSLADVYNIPPRAQGIFSFCLSFLFFILETQDRELS